MCGISAVLGKQCVQKLFEALKQLQNRGYDSAGICSIEKDTFQLHKHASTPSQSALVLLEKELEQHKTNTVGIAHTRWATHGARTDENSHPHMSQNGKFVVVHNGIIENFDVLKDQLITKGYSFNSQTDTEVIVNLLEMNFNNIQNQSNTDVKSIVLESIQKTIEQLEGTWGLAILCIDTPDILYCTRNGSPLLVSCSGDLGMVTSEQSGFCNYVQNYIVLDNHDICYFKRDSESHTISMTMASGREYTENEIKEQISTLTPEPYEHWTLKEINEQVESSLRAIGMGGRLLQDDKVKLGGLEGHEHELLQIDNLILLGCGTSYYAGMVAVHYFKEISGFNTVALYDGAEFTIQDIPTIGNTGLVFLSQSGETKDLHRCIEIGKQNECFMIGVVNVPDSMIAREVHCGCYLNAGREVAVASTKAFTSQLIVLSMLSLWFSQKRNIHTQQRKLLVKDLRRLYVDIKKTIEISEEVITPSFCNLLNHNSCFILGKGKGEAIACEGSLKIKEISYIHCEGYSASSLKHGPFALLGEGFPVILLDICEQHRAKMKSAYQEIILRQASVIVISNVPVEYATHSIVIPNSNYVELLAVIVLQMLAYRLSIKRGINPDMPKNLAKVVTVE